MKRIGYLPAARRNLRAMPDPLRGDFLATIEAVARGEISGEPLKGPLTGAYKLRFDDWRAVYREGEDGILILRLDRRATVYRGAERRG